MKKVNMKIKKLLAVLLVIMTTVAFTPAIALEAFADSDDELTLELVDESKTTYLEGEEILVKATGDIADAWVGLYRVGEIKTPEIGSLRWFYVRDYSGREVNIIKDNFAEVRKDPIRPGEYELILFGNGKYNDIRKTINITVVPDPNKEPAMPSDELSLTLVDESKTTYKIGEPINVRATGIAKDAWVGMYGINDIADPYKGGVNSYRWFYAADNNGEVVDISAARYDQGNRGSLAEGEYNIFLFGDGGYDNIIETITIKIEGIIDIDESQFSIETDKKTYVYGEPIKVKATGTGLGDGAWVGLYPAGTNDYVKTFIYYYYVADFEGIFTTIQTKSAGSVADNIIGDGKYKLVIFADSGYLLPVKSVEITVVREALSSRVLKEPSCEFYGLEYVEYKDGHKEYREIPTLGGHDWSSPVHVNRTSTHKYTCNRDADHEAKIEDCKRENGKVLVAATASSKGKKEYFCSVCNSTYTVAIPKLKDAPKLSATSLAYNGKNIQPAVEKIYDAKGTEISGENYAVSYPSKSKSVGAYKATVAFKGDYSGSYKLSYKVVPKSVKLSKVAGADNAFKATWKKASSQTTGYQIKYSTNKNFKKAKTKKVKGIKKTSTTVKKLKNKKTYYVSVRAYKVVKGKTYYSDWSAAKKVKTK